MCRCQVQGAHLLDLREDGHEDVWILPQVFTSAHEHACAIARFRGAPSDLCEDGHEDVGVVSCCSLFCRMDVRRSKPIPVSTCAAGRGFRLPSASAVELGGGIQHRPRQPDSQRRESMSWSAASAASLVYPQSYFRSSLMSIPGFLAS